MGGRPHCVAHALLRGRYTKAVARVEHAGIPLDTAILRALWQQWQSIKCRLIDEIREQYPIFKGTTLKMGQFESWLIAQRIPWPRTDTGRLSLSEDTFKTMGRAYPKVVPIREVRENLSKLRLSDLAVGQDGRMGADNRVESDGLTGHRQAPALQHGRSGAGSPYETLERQS